MFFKDKETPEDNQKVTQREICTLVAKKIRQLNYPSPLYNN
jgi:hypothetical protein